MFPPPPLRRCGTVIPEQQEAKREGFCEPGTSKAGSGRVPSDPPVLCDRRSSGPQPAARHLETHGQPGPPERGGRAGRPSPNVTAQRRGREILAEPNAEWRGWRPSPNETNPQRKQSGSEGGQGQLCSMPESCGTMPVMAFVTVELSLGCSSCASGLGRVWPSRRPPSGAGPEEARILSRAACDKPRSL